MIKNVYVADESPYYFIFQRAGVTLQQATEAIAKMGGASAKVPFPDGAALRLMRLGAWKRDLGLLRFLFPEWWGIWLSK